MAFSLHVLSCRVSHLKCCFDCCLQFASHFPVGVCYPLKTPKIQYTRYSPWGWRRASWHQPRGVSFGTRCFAGPIPLKMSISAPPPRGCPSGGVATGAATLRGWRDHLPWGCWGWWWWCCELLAGQHHHQPQAWASQSTLVGRQGRSLSSHPLE